jgi:hypothetical protein
MNRRPVDNVRKRFKSPTLWQNRQIGKQVKSVVMLCHFMLTVVYAACRKLAIYGECHYAECHYGECRGWGFSLPKNIKLGFKGLAGTKTLTLS